MCPPSTERGSFVWLNVSGASERDCSLMSLKPQSWSQWAVFFVQIRSGKTYEYATKSLQLKKESHRIILVILYLFWGLPWKSGS